MGRTRTKSTIRHQTCRQNSNGPYSRLDRLDGTHPWQEAVPEGYINYPTRRLGTGKVVYFNYKLAKEMGLIPKSHPHEINAKLHKKLLDTFSLRIINEYDKENNIRYHPKVLKQHSYMATRYLQLQHSDKTGRTSGDGRCIWNGCIENQGVRWDVSSRGTGVTSLAPGAVEAGRPLESGNTDFGYGCGLADIDELIGSAIMSEIFYGRGIETERMLCIIDLGKGAGIGVRAAPNLIRPAHLFMHLKQGNYEALKKSTDYLIDRQFQNGEWPFNSNSAKKYDRLVSEMCRTFAHFAAILEREYIFAWLDWDGDNVLATGGIIDYGSIRQFGLRHDQYRYDDVDRFSTTLNEQRSKTRQIVQAFIQLTDFLNTKNKKPYGAFAEDKILQEFDQTFETYRLQYFLEQVGFGEQQALKILKTSKRSAQKLYDSFTSLEQIKTKAKKKKVADGINRPAVLNLRKGLIYLSNKITETNSPHISLEDFYKVILSENSKYYDRKMTPNRRNKLQNFLARYLKFIKHHLRKNETSAFANRCMGKNRPDRMTGDGLIHVVDKIMRSWKHGQQPPDFMQKAIENLVADQSDPIGDRKAPHADEKLLRLNSTLLTLIDGHKESI